MKQAPMIPPGASVIDRLRIADARLGAGALAEAIAIYTAALAEDGGHPDAWFNLAWAQRANRRFDEALASYAEAIARGVARPQEARLNRAVILSEQLFDVDRAKEELHAALALDPGFVTAWLNLANLHEDLGEVPEAERAYREVLALEPANGRAHARLAAIATFLGRAAEVVLPLRAALPRAPTIDDRADILFALGAALDDIGDYADAFQAIEAANLHARAASPVRYDPRRQEALVDRLIAAFPAGQYLPSPAPPGDEAPVFICGMFRSGSTLAERMLARHAGTVAAGELDFIPALSRQLSPYPEAASALSPDEIARLRARYLHERPPGGVVTDKRCDNFLHLGLIFALFPEARIIHTVRQPLDNLVSIYFQHFGSEITYGSDLRDAAHHYLQYRRLMAHWQEVFGDRIHTLEYDRLVEDPRTALAPVLAALSLPWRDDRSTAPETDAVRTASVWQVRKPLHRRSSGRWRHYQQQLAGVRATLAAAGIEV